MAFGAAFLVFEGDDEMEIRSRTVVLVCSCFCHPNLEGHAQFCLLRFWALFILFRALPEAALAAHRVDLRSCTKPGE